MSNGRYLFSSSQTINKRIRADGLFAKFRHSFALCFSLKLFVYRLTVFIIAGA